MHFNSTLDLSRQNWTAITRFEPVGMLEPILVQTTYIVVLQFLDNFHIDRCRWPRQNVHVIVWNPFSSLRTNVAWSSIMLEYSETLKFTLSERQHFPLYTVDVDILQSWQFCGNPSSLFKLKFSRKQWLLLIRPHWRRSICEPIPASSPYTFPWDTEWTSFSLRQYYRCCWEAGKPTEPKRVDHAYVSGYLTKQCPKNRDADMILVSLGTISSPKKSYGSSLTRVAQNISTF